MRLPRPRFTVRRLMIAVAVVAVLIASAGPARKWYRRYSFYRSQARWYARMEHQARLAGEAERKAAADRAAIESWLVRTQGAADRSPADLARAVDRAAGSHRDRAVMEFRASERFGEERRRNLTAAFWAFDPLAPDVP